MSDFVPFSRAVHARFNELSKHELYKVDVLDLFESYLAAFPEGTNPIFRERTEHDCNCCKQFIRNLGNVVAIVDGKIETVWSKLGKLAHPYDVVAQALDAIVSQAPIISVFRTSEHRFGTDWNRDNLADIVWNHFHGEVAARHRTSTPAAVRGKFNTKVGVLRRGLEELTLSAFEMVDDLIKANALYRGQEFAKSVRDFMKLRRAYDAAENHNLFVWANAGSDVSGFRNTAIGTLLIDLSGGMDLEIAVRRYESTVAPQNYKRSSALITPKMIDAAMEKLRALGLESAVERRHARIEDVSVNNVLFVDNRVRDKMRDGYAALLMEEVKTRPVDVKNAQPISMEEFLETVVPNASSIDLLVENEQMSNFMSLTAPAAENTGRLFQWANDFAWAYDGDVTDSVKQRVKAAGGKTDALLRCSLAWFNTDDLDISARTPDGQFIYFGDRQGVLDVDMNVSSPVRDAVENLSWNSVVDGEYKITVHNYHKRENIDTGFVLEVEFGGAIHQFKHEADLRDSQRIEALVLVVKNGALVEIKTHASIIGGGSISNDKWGIKTNQLVPVDTLLASPNHWDEQGVGNKHWFFILKDCRNPDPVRGMYNEFLRPELNEHRKVFEVLGAKTKCQPSDKQLSGLGFSSTRKDKATVIVKGQKINKAFAIHF